MYKGTIEYTTEDAAWDEIEGLNDFRGRNLHREHDSDIDKVKYEKVDNEIRFESDDKKALQYVMEFASETEDNVISWTKNWK